MRCCQRMMQYCKSTIRFNKDQISRDESISFSEGTTSSVELTIHCESESTALKRLEDIPETDNIEMEHAPNVLILDTLKPPFCDHTASLLCHKFCGQINGLYQTTKYHANDAAVELKPKSYVAGIYSENVVITFGNVVLKGLDRVYKAYRRIAKGKLSRSSEFKIKSFDTSSVTFVEDVIYQTLDGETLNLVLAWKLIVDDEGKVESQECLDPDQAVIDDYLYVVWTYGENMKKLEQKSSSVSIEMGPGELVR